MPRGRHHPEPVSAKRAAASRARLPLTFIFFASGAGGLGCQIVWAKLFAAGAGHEFPAVLAVVTAFMAGMAFGAWAFDRLPLKLRSNPRAYGWLELLIAFWAAATFFAIPAANGLMLDWLGPEAPPLAHWTIVFGAVLLTLLPATAAMGATLPAIEIAITGGLNRTITGLLYGANTAGAVAGALASAYLIMPALGLGKTILLFAALNASCGAAGLALARSIPPAQLPLPRTAAPSRRLAATLAAAGLLGIGFETIIIRLLGHALESTVYTFAVVLAVYLLGHAGGAAGFQALRRRGWNPSRTHLLLAAGAACLASGILARALLPFYSSIRALLGDSPFEVMLGELAAGALLFFLPAAAMGALFTRLAEESLAGRQTLGWAASINTAGAAAAPVLFGAVLFPWFGTRFTLWLIAAGYIALVPKTRAALAGLAVTAILTFALPRTADLIKVPPGSKILELREGAMATAAVLESTHGERVLKVNNRFQMGGTAAAAAEQRHADIPLLLHPDPRRALFLGLGTGITFAAATNYPGLQADGVELLPEVAALMPRFIPGGANPFNTPPLEIIVADARRFMATTTNRYDVIVGDLFHPARDGAGFLYTREHFQAIRERLRPGGLFCQWLPLYQMDAPTLRAIIATFLRVFPDAQAWLLRSNISTPVLGLAGAVPPEPDYGPRWVEPRLDHPPLAEHLRKIALADSIRLFGSFAGSAASLSRFAAGAPINTDDRPLVLFRAPIHTYRRGAKPYATLQTFLETVHADASALELGDPRFTASVQAYINARNIYLAGLIHEAEGRPSKAIAAYVESARVSTDFTSGYAQCITIATALARTQPAAARQILQALDEAQPARPIAAELLRRLPLQ